MANAEFSRQEQNKNKGFAAGSYRKKEAAAPKRALSPLQQKLTGLENALPAALRQQTVAAVLCVVMAAAAVFGLGGAKLNSRYEQVKNSFTAGVGADDPYPIGALLNERANHAANIITAAGHAQGVTQAYLDDAQLALDEFAKLLEKQQVWEIYNADVRLQSAIELLYADMQAKFADDVNMDVADDAYSKFTNAGFVISTSPYNDEAAAYNEMAGQFPASLIAGLRGIDWVELYE